MRGDDRFALTVRLPSGEQVDVPLGPFWSTRHAAICAGERYERQLRLGRG